MSRAGSARIHVWLYIHILHVSVILLVRQHSDNESPSGCFCRAAELSVNIGSSYFVTGKRLAILY